MSSTAVTPNSSDLIKAIQSMRDEKHEEMARGKGVDKEDIKVAEIAAMDGWVELKDFINHQIKILEGAPTGAMDTGASLEIIGLKSVVSQLAIEKLRAVIQFVEQRAKYVHERE